MIRARIQNILIRLLGHDYRIAVLRARGAKIGKEVHYQNEYLPSISETGRLSIGDYSSVSNRVQFIFHDGSIGSLINRNPHFKKRKIFVHKSGDIRIGNHVVIGAHSIILPSVTIGDFSVVAAGSVVSKSIPPGEIWGGVPAKFIKRTVDWVDEVLRANGISMDRAEIEQCLSLSNE